MSELGTLITTLLSVLGGAAGILYSVNQIIKRQNSRIEQLEKNLAELTAEVTQLKSVNGNLMLENVRLSTANETLKREKEEQKEEHEKETRELIDKHEKEMREIQDQLKLCEGRVDILQKLVLAFGLEKDKAPA